jgi:hypothetical protein
VDDPRTCYLRNGAGRSMLTSYLPLKKAVFLDGVSGGHGGRRLAPCPDGGYRAATVMRCRL